MDQDKAREQHDRIDARVDALQAKCDAEPCLFMAIRNCQAGLLDEGVAIVVTARTEHGPFLTTHKFLIAGSDPAMDWVEDNVATAERVVDILIEDAAKRAKELTDEPE